MKTTLKEVAAILKVDLSEDSGKLTLYKGKFTRRVEYFLEPTLTPEKFFYGDLAALQAAYGGPNIKVIRYGNKRKTFKGGRGVAENSHYFFEFKIEG